MSELPRLPGRSRTYAAVLGSAAVLAVVGAGLPLIFGHSPTTAAGVATLTPGGTTNPLTGTPVSPTLPGASGAAPTTGPAGGPAQAGVLPGQTSNGVTPGGAGVGSGGAGPAGTTTGGSTTTGRVGSTGGSGAGTGSGSGRGTGSAASAGRTASDTGVTATTITLGVLLTDLATNNPEAGSFTGYSPAQQQEYFDAYVDDVNSHGGVDGRQLKPAYETSDITDNNSQKAACDTVTDTDHAFAVTSVLGIYGPPILCLTQTHQVPYLANDGAVSDYYKQSSGRLFTLQPSTLRTEANAVFEDVQSGELKAGDKVGFLREDGYLTADETSVEDYLRGFGVTVTDGIMSSASIQDAPSQAAVAAQRFCSAGDTKVFFAVNQLYAQDFIMSLPPGCNPDYYSSDFDYQMDGNTFVSGMPASYFKHAVGVSSSDVGSAFTATESSCLAVYNTYLKKIGKPAVAASDEKALQAVAVCGLVRTFILGVTRAGVNPTRSSFLSALSTVGSFDNAGYDASSFRNGKTDAPDTVRMVHADAGCKCWVANGGGAFHAAHFR